MSLGNMTEHAQDMTVVTLGTAPISLAEFVAVARHGARVEFSKEYEERVRHSRSLIERFLAENRLIYGVTTGFGSNVSEVIAPKDAAELQRNIVVSHAVSVGAPLTEEIVRSIQLTELVSLGQGYSGINLGTLGLIRDLLNHQVTPYAPGSGSVGYLAVEAHLAMVLIGEGRAWVNGKVVLGAEALAGAGLTPLTLGCKEGLSLTNGTHSVNAIAALTAYDAIRIGKLVDLSAAMSLEALKGNLKAFDPRLQAVRKHPEQAAAAANVRNILAGSPSMEALEDYRVQDPLSLRAIPQVNGGAKRAIKNAVEVILEAMDSLGDNPVIVPEGDDGVAIMGGNFDSSFVGIQAAALTTALTVLAKNSERRTDRMVNANFSELPAFLTPDPGLNNGYMIVQYTAAALYMEMKALGTAAIMDSVPTSGNQEDPVSNAYLAATQAYQAVGKARYILGIELMCAVQALELGDGPGSSAVVQAVRDEIRTVVPPADADRFFGDDIEAMERLVRDDRLLRIVEEHIGALGF